MSARLESSRRVVHHCHHIDLHVLSLSDRLSQQLDHILTLDSFAREAFGPLDESGFGQSLLTTREGEGEAERELVLLESALGHESGQTLGDVVEELLSGAEHDVLRHRIDLVVHLEVVAFELNEKHSEVGSAQIQCQEFALFCGQRVNDL